MVTRRILGVALACSLWWSAGGSKAPAPAPAPVVETRPPAQESTAPEPAVAELKSVTLQVPGMTEKLKLV
jgi:hypothetical protein